MRDMPPLIGIDGSRLGASQRTGTENYSSEITKHLLELDLPVRWRLYLNEAASSATFSHWSALAETRPIPALRLWTHGRLSAEMVRHAPDLLFVPAHVVPLYHPPTIVTVHDLGYLRFPDAHPTAQRRMLDLSSRWSARAARHIIVPSQATKHDLVRFYGVDEHKVSVVHHGVSPRFQPAPAEQVEALRSRLELDGPYILSVGTIQPRKNFETLAKALGLLLDQGVDCPLVIAGKRGWLAERVLDRLHALRLGDRLCLLDYVSDEDLPAIYTGASCYVQPSLFEGFGMPVLEAMSCAVPVLVSNASSLPEVAGDGAIQFDPHDAEELASALHDVLTSAELRDAMAERSLERSKAFSWQRAAEQTGRLLLEHTS